MRLIDADILEIRLANLPEMWTSWNHWKRVRAIIEDMTKVDLVKHGHWIQLDKKYLYPIKCSVCGWETWFGAFNYCPNCGAVMQEDKNET